MLGVGDVDRAVSFWSRALGYESVNFTDSDNGFTILMPPSGEGTRVALQRAAHTTPGASGSPPRPRRRRRRRAGGRDPAPGRPRRRPRDGDLYPPNPDFVVLADPDGNRFCVVDASHG